MKNKEIQAIAEVVRPDDRNEFIRLRRTENEREPGASGAPAKSSLKKKGIQKPYFPTVNLPEVPIDSPAFAGGVEEKIKEKSKKNQNPKSTKKFRRAVADASFLSDEIREEDNFIDLDEPHGVNAPDGNALEDLNAESVHLNAESVLENPDAVFAGPDAVADPAEDQANLANALAEAIDENGLTFVEPAQVFPAETRAHRRQARGIVVSKRMPIKPEDLLSFVKDVKAISWKRLSLKPVFSSKIRKLVLKDLRDVFCVKMVDAEALLQMSYLLYGKYVSGPGDDAVEHFNIAYAVGQVRFEGEERVTELGKWHAHVLVPDCGPVDARVDPSSADGSGSESEESEAASPTTHRAGLNAKSDATHCVSCTHAKGPSTSKKSSSTPRAVRLPGAGTPPTLTRVTVPVVPQVVEESLSYTESLARELRRVSLHSPDRTSQVSNLALDRALNTIRKCLPEALADAAVDGLIRANDNLRGESATKGGAASEVGPASASKLGRGYRLGALSREQRGCDHHVNRVGARASSGDAPEAHLCSPDRAARFNTSDQKILGTLRKVLDSEECSKLNARQKLRVMGRAIRQQLHDEEVASLSLSRKGKNRVSPAGSDGGDDGDEDSFGDSCGRTTDSRGSSETYARDSFCASDSEMSVRSDSGRSSDSEGDDDRAKRRENSNNSLGTPDTTKKAAAGSAASAANQPPPNLVLLGDEDLPLWKSGPARFKQGFHWESYLHHKQQYDNYKAHRGRYSDRTFKSVIDSKLVPAVCSSCGFRRSSWADLPDHRLILRLERVLRPSRSTDFAMELKKIQLEQYGDEPLQASYSTFAEKFLGKVAEAADAGRPVNSVVVKAAYKKAVEVEVPLKTWLEGVRWRGVDHAHQRLLRKLREARSWEAMSKTVGGSRTRRAAPRADEEDVGADQPGASKSRFKPRQRGRMNAGRGTVRRGRGASRRAKVNSSGGKFQGKAPGRRDGDSRSGPKAEKLRTWRGYDQRGESWHSDKDLFECFKKPCNALFCQRCARHGHTADYCRVPDGTEGLNQSGYFQDARPGKAGPKRPPARNNSSRGGARNNDGSGDDGSEGATEHQGGHEDEGDSHRGSGLARRSNSSGRGRQGRGSL